MYRLHSREVITYITKSIGSYIKFAFIFFFYHINKGKLNRVEQQSVSGETCSNIVHIIKFSNRREVFFAKLQSFSLHHLQLPVHLGIKLDSTVADIDF